MYLRLRYQGDGLWRQPPLRHDEELRLSPEGEAGGQQVPGQGPDDGPRQVQGGMQA